MEEHIHRIYHSTERCQRIDAAEGVGPVIATAIVAAIADGRAFHNGRQFAAWLVLAPSVGVLTKAGVLPIWV